MSAIFAVSFMVAAVICFIDKAYVLLVFAGIWALMQGVSDIVRAFTVRQLNKSV